MQPDLLIKEIDHASVLKRALFTPLDWHLLRHCPVPVYLVGGSGLGLPRKIVAAVEVSDVESADDELNDRIIKQACSLAMQCNAELHLLHACDISAVFLADMDGLTLADLTKELRRDLEKSSRRQGSSVPSIVDTSSTGIRVKVLRNLLMNTVDADAWGRVQSHGLTSSWAAPPSISCIRCPAAFWRSRSHRQLMAPPGSNAIATICVSSISAFPRNRKEAVLQVMSTSPAWALAAPVRYLMSPTGEISPKPIVVYVVKEKYTQSISEPSKLPVKRPHRPACTMR